MNPTGKAVMLRQVFSTRRPARASVSSFVVGALIWAVVIALFAVPIYFASSN